MTDQALELAAARRRIKELETELAVSRKVKEIFLDQDLAQSFFPVIDSLAGQGIDVGHACHMLRVSRSGFYAWKDRPASARALRHLWLAGRSPMCTASPAVSTASNESRPSYDTRGILVNRKTVTLADASPRSLRAPEKRLPKAAKVSKFAASDLVRREFAVTAPDRLWMTDTTEHPTREGQGLLLRSPRCVPARSSASRSTPSRTRCSSRAP